MKKLIQLALVLFLVFSFGFALSCKKAEKAEVEEVVSVVDLEAAKVAVNSVLDQWMQMVDTENLELFSKLIAHDPDMVSFGTDSAERWVGYESFENAMKKQFESVEVSKGTSRERVIVVHKSGEVAWLSCLWDWTGKAQGESFALAGMRVTGVLEKRNGNWVFVQVHASVPVSGQAVKY
jgi:ketosteroid isomerase-like protein